MATAPVDCARVDHPVLSVFAGFSQSSALRCTTYYSLWNSWGGGATEENRRDGGASGVLEQDVMIIRLGCVFVHL